MLSTFPAMSFDGLFGNPFPTFEGGFTPWDCQEPPFVFPQHDEPEPQPEPEPVLCPLEPQEPIFSNSGSNNSNPIPVDSNSGSDNSNAIPVDSNSGSDEPSRKRKNSSSGSDDTNPTVDSVIDERKRRRMISNRESARRSRMRKQKHLENLRIQVNRLRVGNRELMNRLRLVTHHCRLVRNDNDRLRSESVVLRQRLFDIRQVLFVRQLQQQLSSSAWPCNNFTSVNEGTIPQSLIT